MMATPLMAAAVAFLVTLVLGYPYVAVMRRLGVVKLVRSQELPSHLEKTGAPTMGGLLFCLTISLLTIALNATVYHESGRSILLPVTVLAASAILGALDDRLSLVGSRGDGLSMRIKFALMGLIGLDATLAVVALMLGQGVLLPVVGFVFVVVTVSVILQVGYFKDSRGWRLFGRAPLHRHLRLVSWAQTQVAQRFWLASMVAALVGVALALL